MNRPIVIGTDFRAQADRALDRAVLLGEQWNSEVVVVHALDPNDRDQPSEAELERRLQTVLPSTSARVTFRCHHGEANTVITDIAHEVGAAVIVLGVARYNSFRDYVLGTAVDYVIRDTSIPVLVVKSRPRRPYQRIVSATDFHKPSRVALEKAADLFPNCPLEVVHAFHVPFEGWQQAEYVRDQMRDAEQKVFDEFMAELRPETRARITQHLAYGSVHTAMLRELEEGGADLVVIGTHGESALRHATLGSTASELLRLTPIDTLVVGPEA